MRDVSSVSPAELAARRDELDELKTVEREMKTARWSVRQEEAALAVAMRGGEPLWVGISGVDGDAGENGHLATLLVWEVVQILSGKPLDAFDFQTSRRPWRVTVKRLARGQAGRVEATALGRGLLRALPNICASTSLYVEGSAARSWPR